MFPNPVFSLKGAWSSVEWGLVLVIFELQCNGVVVHVLQSQADQRLRS